MMKWIFGLLLLANVAFFAVMQWGSALTVDANNPPVQAPLNADKIKIVNLAAASAPASAVPATTPAASSVSAAPPVVASAPVPMVAAPLPVPAAAPTPAPAKLSCMEWGEFSGEDLRRANTALAALKLGNKLKQRVVEYTSGYWVYIAPLKTPAQTKQKIALLKKLGIGDYFIVKEPGAWMNSISLGVFRSEDAAKKHWAVLHKQGLKSAKMGERPLKLKFTVFVLNHVDSTVSAHIASLRKDFSDSEIKQVPCN